ncbi:MAG: sensor histidine kinase [Myxococcota bacterium]
MDSPPFIAALKGAHGWVEPLSARGPASLRVERFLGVEEALSADEKPDVLLSPEATLRVPGIIALGVSEIPSEARVQDILQIAALTHQGRVQARELGSMASLLMRHEQWQEDADRAFRTLLHELRTPVAVAQGWVANLRDGIFGALEGEAQEATERSTSALKHLAELLGVASLPQAPNRPKEARQDGRGQARKRLQLSDLAEEAAAMLASEAQHTAVKFKLEPASEIPKIWANPRGILQILVNLMSNGLRHAPQGSTILLRLGRVPASRPARVYLEVLDEGPGVRAEVRPRVFDAGISGDGRTGLGLAISKEIAHEHGGGLSLLDVPGKGACFRLELPADPRERRSEHRVRVVQDPELGLHLAAALITHGILVKDEEFEIDEVAGRVLLGQESVLMPAVDAAALERMLEKLGGRR